MSNAIAGIMIVGAIILGAMFMAEKVEDSRAQRIRAEVALVQTNADAREGRMALVIIALAGASVFGLLIVGLIAFTWPQRGGDRNGQLETVHHHHTERIIERHTVVYLNEGSKRDFYKAIGAGQVHYIAQDKETHYING